MKLKCSIEHDNAENGVRSVYSYTLELPDKTTLETVEAHLANAVRILDRQASERLDGDDDDDKDGSDAWKAGDKPKPSGPSSAAA